MIEIKDVTKTFQNKKIQTHALNGVSLTIQDGEIYGIIGYSGAGKSTLVRLLNQLETQSSGSILIDGVDISTLSKKELNQKRQQIGMIFQHFNLLWSRTVLENIELPLEIAGLNKDERRKRAIELVHLVGLDGKEDVYPANLSGGQKQRVGIARALANRPSILLCDEATSALDPETTEQILALLKVINEKMKITIVLITHQMEVVQNICHKMAVMSDGKVVEEGTVRDLFARPQHPVTKKFVQNLDPCETFEETQARLKKSFPNGLLLRVSYTGDNTEEAIIATAIRSVSFPVSIVESNMSSTQGGIYGATYLHIYHGEKEEYERFIEVLKSLKVEVEVLA